MDSNEYLITSSQSSQQFSACLWDYNTLNVQKYYRNGGTASNKCLDVIGQDYLLISEAGKPLVHVWPLNNQNVAKNIRLILPEPANCLTVCPHNVYLAVGINCKVYLWHISSGKLMALQEKNYQPVTCIKFSSDGDFLLVAGQDGVLMAYNLCDLTAFSNNFLSQNDIGQVEPVYVISDSMAIQDIYIGSFGRKSKFATVSEDHSCRIYRLLTGEVLLNLIFEDSLTSVVFDAPCWHLYIGTEKGNIIQFNLEKPPATLSHHVDGNSDIIFSEHNKKIVCLALNNSNTVLASGSDDHFVITWDTITGSMLKKIEHKAPITNIKFVLAYKNFFVENFKPKIVLKSLKRNRDSNNDFVVSQIQTDDIELSDDETSLSKEQIRSNLDRDNRKLRIMSKQLYHTILAMSKSVNMENGST